MTTLSVTMTIKFDYEPDIDDLCDRYRLDNMKEVIEHIRHEMQFYPHDYLAEYSNSELTTIVTFEGNQGEQV